MAIARAMRRLLQVREIEEEQAKVELESALGELRLLKHGLAAAVERNRAGRRLVTASAVSGSLTDRWAGLEEVKAGNRCAALLTPRISEAELAVSMRRQVYLARRVERRQVETLIEAAEARESLDDRRRGQQALDDWYLSSKFRIDHKLGHRGASNEQE